MYNGTLVLAVAALVWPADGQVLQLHVPSGDAGRSIPELAHQAGVQIIGPGNALRGVVTPEVEGTFDVVAALELMLRDTDLKVNRSGVGIITISRNRRENACNDEGEFMTRKSKLAATSSWIAMLLGVTNCAVAQGAGSLNSGAMLETVVVTGMRASLSKAEDIKRTESNIVDSIVPEDIGKLPDETVGETLQRISGIQVSRANDQVTGVNIRGLPNLITTLNGNEVFTTNGRTFAFQNLPAEVLAGLKVYKTVSADNIEGGIAGLINVRTHRPFDFRGLQIAGSASEVYGSVVQKMGQNFDLLVSDRWRTSIGEFGALINVAWKKTPYLYPINWQGTPRDPRTTASTGLDVPVFVPNVGTSTASGTREYPEANIALQYRPNNNMEFHFDMLWAGWRARYSAAYFNASTTATNLPLSSVVIDRENCVTLVGTQYGCLLDSLSAGGGATGVYPYTYTSNQAHDTMSDDFLGSFGGRYSSGRWLIESDFSGVMSTYHDVRETIDMNIKKEILTISGTNYHDHPVWSVSVDPSDPSNFYLQSLGQSFENRRGSQFSWTGHATYEFTNSPITMVDAGVRLASRKGWKVASGAVSTPYPGGNGTALATTVFGNDFFQSMKGFAGYPAFVMPSTQYLMDSIQGVRSVYGASTEISANPLQGFDDLEQSMDFWLKANYDISLLSIPIDGEFGVRTVTIDRTLRGSEATAVANTSVVTPYSREGSNTDVLPSINTRVHLADDVLFRASFGKTVTLPAFADLMPSGTVTPPSKTTEGNVSEGNPDLGPTRSTAYDISLEYYFPGGGMVTLAGFYRDVKGYAEDVKEARPYDPNFCATNGIADGMCYLNVSTVVSSGKGYIEGYELSAQKFADFLPGMWSGFGAQLTYSWIQSNAPIAGNDYFAAAEGELTNVSKHNYSVVLLYEKYGLSVRLAATYRSKFIDSYYPGNDTTPPINYVKGTTYVDLGVNYALTPQITLATSATNLLGEHYSSYSGTPLFPRDYRVVNKTYKFGIRYRLN